MSLKYFDIGCQTWPFRMPRPKNSHFQHGI